MKISHITIDNVLGIKRIDVQLASGVALFCGLNGHGKSSIENSVRLALTSSPSRVSKKMDYAKLVREGAKKGAIKIATDGGAYEVALPAGKNSAVIDGDAIRYVLSPELFATTSPADRKKFLFELSGQKINTEAVRKSLANRGADVQLAESVIPLLRAGFPEAHNAAKDKATESRGVWKGITGENYGSDKAEGWTRDAEELTEEQRDTYRQEIAEAQTRLEDVKASIEAQNQHIGTLRAQESAYKMDQAAINGLKQRAALFGRADDALKAAEKQLLEQAQTIIDLRNKTGGGQQQEPQPCPHCGGAIDILDGILHAHASQPYDADAAAMLPRAEEALLMLKRAAENRKRDWDDADAAAKTLQERTNVEPLEEGAIETATGKLGALKSAQTDLEREIVEVTALLNAATDAASVTEKATAAHRAVVEWVKIADAFSPDGIPSEMLAAVLTPINNRIRASAINTEWLQPHISPDMEILVGTRSHALLSESERWRVDAMIAEAISHLSGLKLLSLDRFDVLEPNGRMAPLNWLLDLADAGELDTALIFGTLKTAPEIPGIDSFWIENGAIATKQERAA